MWDKAVGRILLNNPPRDDRRVLERAALFRVPEGLTSESGAGVHRLILIAPLQAAALSSFTQRFSCRLYWEGERQNR